jgi:hypothetical protein
MAFENLPKNWRIMHLLLLSAAIDIGVAIEGISPDYFLQVFYDLRIFT